MALLEAVIKGDMDFVRGNFNGNPYLKNEWADYKLLNAALQHNESEIAVFLIKKGCTIKRKTRGEEVEDTPLHRAVLTKNVELVEMLLKNGASLEVKNPEGDTPLHVAAKTDWESHIDTIMPYVKATKNSNISNKHGLTHMHIACMSSFLPIVKKFLKSKVNVNHSVKITSPYCPGYTCLHFAIHSEQAKVIELLLANGADINAKDSKGMTSLHLAFMKNNKELLNSILETYGSTISNCIDDQNIAYIHIAASEGFTDILKRFLEGKCDVNGCIKHDSPMFAGFTPLHFAVMNDHINAVECLLEQGASFFIKDAAGFTALHLAFLKRKDNITDLLLSEHHKNLENSVDPSGITHFHIACSRNFPNLIEAFLINGNDVNMCIKEEYEALASCTPLHVAVIYEQPSNVKLLLENKADVDKQNKEGLAPLHIVCKGTFEDIPKLENLNLLSFTKPKDIIQRWLDSIHKSRKIIDLLVEYNANVELQDKQGKISLFHVYDEAYCRVFEGLLYALIREKDQNLAIKSTKEMIDFRRYLVHRMIKNITDLSVTDNTGLNILHFSTNLKKCLIENEELLVELYIAKGADVNAKSNINRTPLHNAVSNDYDKIVDVLLQHNSDPNTVVSDTMYTPLHEGVIFLTSSSSKAENKKVLNKLIDKGANVNAKASDGSTPLHLMFRSSFDRKENEYSCLFTLDCDIDLQDNTGLTALHCATRAKKSNVGAIKWLLNCGANIDIKDDRGKTPLMYADERIDDVAIYHAYLNHMKKYKMISHHYSRENEACAAKLQKKILDFMDLKEEKCLEELKKLRNFKINDDTSLYDILHKGSIFMFHRKTNEILVKFQENDLFEKEFPLYGFLLKLQVRKGIVRPRILKRAKDSLDSLMLSKLNDLCYEIILSFLENDDLKTLIVMMENTNSLRNIQTKTEKKDVVGTAFKRLKVRH